MNHTTKIRTIIFAFSLAAATILAVVVRPFTNWEEVASTSPEIIVARCLSTPQPLQPDENGAIKTLVSGLLNSSIEPMAVLKGKPVLGSATLCSQYWPRQGEAYLIYARSMTSNVYNAVESYRVVPLGINFFTNYIVGSSLEEKQRSLLAGALRLAKTRLQEDQAAEARLESAFQH
jgi:hypothetical protein